MFIVITDQAIVHTAQLKNTSNLFYYTMFRGSSGTFGECWSSISNLVTSNRWRESLELSYALNYHYMQCLQSKFELQKAWSI